MAIRRLELNWRRIYLYLYYYLFSNSLLYALLFILQAAAHTLAQEFETRCAAVRAKHAATRTPQEREWVKIDKVMFPDIWRVKRRQEERWALQSYVRANFFFAE